MKKINLQVILIGVLIFSACYQSLDEQDNKKTPARKSPTATIDNSVSNNSNNSNNAKNDNSNVNTQNSGSSNNQTTQNTESNDIKSGGFMANLPSGFVQPSDSVGKLLLREYGAMFVARGGVTPAKTIIFKDEAEVSSFQKGLSTSTETIGGFSLELQSAAMKGLKDAIAEAKQSNLTITPRGKDSAKRNYNDTIELWKSRVEPGLKHWTGKGKLTQSEANRIKALPIFEQITEVLKLEEKSLYFAKSLDKSIIYSVAPPGTSQHISMLAIDIKENENAKVREILAKHGWFQTVKSDLPHFTFLGVKEDELPKLGLKKVNFEKRTYWMPDI